ncbi:MAG: efflux RND transporter permease subunit [bacterium]|nr:efflux RND transporter permease subunit [bacterium]
MSLPDLSVRRPVTVFVATLAVTVFGFIAANQLDVELLPDLSFPTLTIQTEYSDAAPVSVEQFVTRPMEESVGVIPGLREMRSVSRAGVSEVVLEFDWDEPMGRVSMEVREKMGLAELPREAARPRLLRFDPSLDPIVRLAFSGERSLDELRQVAERWLRPRLEAVSGVAAAKVRGGLDAEIQIEADEDRLAALGLTLDDLGSALRSENVNRPGGTIKDWGAVYLVRTMHEFEDLEQVRKTVVRDQDSGRVRVEDVAVVRRGHRDRDEITRNSGEEAVEIALYREGSSNTLAVSAAIREQLAELESEMGADLRLTLLTDQSTYIGRAVNEVRNAALLGGVLAILVLYFFLRDAASTAVVTLTIPISVVATFLPMFKAGVTLNIMSLGGLALGIGMLVDNSIVVLEAIDRHRRKGVGRAEAARLGGAEVAGAVTAATLTTVCVFLPIVFVQGVAGQLFYDLAVTVCLSLLASLVVSLTLIPMLSALEYGELRRVTPRAAVGSPRPWGETLLRPVRRELPMALRAAGALVFPLWAVLVLVWRAVLRPLVLGLLLLLQGALHLLVAAVGAAWWGIAWTFHALSWPATRVFDGLGAAYPGVVRGALRARWAILPLSFALFALSLGVFSLLGTDLVPDLAQGEFAFRLKSGEGSTLQSTADVVARIESRMAEDPRVARVFSVVGSLPSTASGRQTFGENLAQINLVLKDGLGEGAEAETVRRMRRALELFPGVEAELVRPSVLAVRPPIVLNLFGDDLGALDRASAEMVQRIGGIAGVEDVASTSEPGNPEITIELDRERAADLGVVAERLGESLRRQIRGDVVGQFREGEERIDIRLRASEDARDRAARVQDLRYRLENGTAVPVSAVAEVKLGRGPAAIHRVSGGRVAQVTARTSDPDLGRVLGEVRERALRLETAGVVAEMAGQDRDLAVSFSSLKLALALAIFMVYVVMAVQFESLRYPFVILLSVPLGVVGVVAALWLTATPVSVLALIGAVMLAGIVVNNAIVLVDAINRRCDAGQEVREAIVDAGRERLRPIVMTTATTVLALMPMALGLGSGAELRRPLAITVVGGLSAATLLTLIVIPCLYLAFSRVGNEPAVASSAVPGGEAEEIAS